MLKTVEKLIYGDCGKKIGNHSKVALEGNIVGYNTTIQLSVKLFQLIEKL